MYERSGSVYVLPAGPSRRRQKCPVVVYFCGVVVFWARQVFAGLFYFPSSLVVGEWTTDEGVLWRGIM
jgi:hypothetical protein